MSLLHYSGKELLRKATTWFEIEKVTPCTATKFNQSNAKNTHTHTIGLKTEGNPRESAMQKGKETRIKKTAPLLLAVKVGDQYRRRKKTWEKMGGGGL